MTDDIPLDRVQRWFQTVITHPGGVPAGAASDAARAHVDLSAERIEELIAPSRRLTAVERLGVYSTAYFARLLECLEDEFPATRHAVGDDAFRSFALDSLQQRPSQSYTLAALGAGFPRHLDESRPPTADSGNEAFAEFVVDLARLERAYSEVFDGPGMEREPPLRVEAFVGIPPDQWESVRLIPSRGLRLEAFRHPVHDYASAVKRRQNPALPAPRATRLAIYRANYVVRRVALEETPFVLLSRLLKGATLGEAIAAAIDESCASDAGLAGNLRSWFEDWTSRGFFRSLTVSDA